MPISDYGVLCARVLEARREDGQSTPHYQIHALAGQDHFRLAVNVKSQVSPSDLLFLVDENFSHPVTTGLAGLAEGFHPLASARGGTALDYIRGNLFDRTAMRPLPPSLPGADNDLADRLAHFVDRAVGDTEARVFAFGAHWGPEPRTKDKVFGFLPGNGVHDIHMNQGNDPGHRGDDGVWQDGALILRFGAQWVAIFLAFQSQAWHTDDQTGHALTEPPGGPGTDPGPGEPDHQVRIVAALANAVGPAPEAESVTLLNRTPAAIDLGGWKLVDRVGNRQTLAGSIEAGAALRVAVAMPVALGNKGGTITIIDKDGLKVDGVAYTAADAEAEGWTIVFGG